MRKRVKYSGALLLLLFAFFFASANCFPHVHEGEGGRIVHSHPWSAKSHNHSDAQFQTIQILSVFTFQNQEALLQQTPYLVEEVAICSPLSSITARNLIHHVLGLRAPPASL